ncbi:hypothetical protein BU23DRAFT_540996 [Bimuria novae-zelandiae CBS 107.79]|uniref:Mitochondrial K+-H+ exchange-related-domain-containing protein n=1 Tax=Bimuria novae-zelandiae CBS 107.79 TaxID=1447943 RepID=A0A6A5V088_9PLEO|nr:hypothetical protein BU23DRAFT_540996 [Bimuria novae-zelandiae CBS 107.79]
MRLFLLPISTRRSLIYCERLNEQARSERGLLDRITNKASETWVAWETDDKAPLNWKKRVTLAGNQALKRIPFEEWGLKTLPALTAKRKAAVLEGREKWQVMYPGLYLQQDKVPGILEKLAKEKQAMYRTKMIWSVVAMPFTIPFALIPIIPNLPFFYLVYRAYSYWKALSGSKYLEFLLKQNLPTPNPSAELDEVYTAGLMYPTRQVSRAAPSPSRQQQEEVARVVQTQTNGGAKDAMVLQRWNGKLIAEQFHLPDMEVEIERAVEQVEQSIKAKDELVEEKLELEKATAKPGQTAKDALPKDVLQPLEEAEKRIHEQAAKVAHENDEKK